MNQHTNSPIDLVQLNQISEGDIEFEVEVLQVYVEDISQRIEKLREAIANNNLLQISQEAHHMKGSSSNVGALQVRDLAVQIEGLNLEQDLEKALNILDDMDMAIQAVDGFVLQKAAKLSS
jgi:HPt (histidine-containing phosphotransfer) domain-containing protein